MCAGVYVQPHALLWGLGRSGEVCATEPTREYISVANFAFCL